MPEQFDTVVGERGVQLSGGQKQRIALARALVWEPKILVLDDPLSAVDAKTERAILDAIERQAEVRTVVLVTHRVAAAARCDEVVVLDEGRVVERGTHADLVKRRWFVRRLRRGAGDAERARGAFRMNLRQPFRTKAAVFALPSKPRGRANARARAENKLRAFHEEDAVTKTYDGSLLLRLWPFLRPHSDLRRASRW